jgi:hypothetical protein
MSTYETKLRLTTDRDLTDEQIAHLQDMLALAIKETLGIGTLNAEADSEDAPEVHLLDAQVTEVFQILFDGTVVVVTTEPALASPRL